MLNLGTQKIKAVFLGDTKIKRAYLGSVVVFDASVFTAKTITVISSGLSSALLAKGTLSVDGQEITDTSTTVKTQQDTVTVVFTLTRGVSTARTVIVNDVDLGHVQEAGDTVSTTLPVQDGMTISISIETYTPPVPIYTITASIDPAGSGTVTGAGSYQEGQQVTIQAIPGDGYEFSAWKENGAAVSTNAAYTFTVSGDRALVAEFAAVKTSRLPDGYTEVQYVQTGSQTCGFNTGVVPTVQTRIVMDVEMIRNVSGSKHFFSSHDSSTSSANLYCYSSTGANFIYKFGTMTAVTKTISSLVNRRVVVDCRLSTGAISIGSDSYTFTVPSVLPEYPIHLLYMKQTGVSGTRNGFPGNVYSAQIYSGSTLVRDFVPCTNPNGKAGLFDLVGKTFYENINANTTVTAGPAV